MCHGVFIFISWKLPDKNKEKGIERVETIATSGINMDHTTQEIEIRGKTSRPSCLSLHGS